MNDDRDVPTWSGLLAFIPAFDGAPRGVLAFRFLAYAFTQIPRSNLDVIDSRALLSLYRSCPSVLVTRVA